MRQLFYLLMMLNLLLFLWIYQTERQLNQQQIEYRAIGDLQIVSEAAIQEIESAAATTEEREVQSPQPERTRQNIVRQAAQKTDAKPEATQQCTTLGPVATYMQAKMLGVILSRFNLASSIRAEVAVSIDAYEVIFPPFDSNDAAARALRELQQSGSGNAYIIRTGKLRKGISVGVYHYRDDAQRRLLGVGRFAGSPAIIERGDQSTLYWVDMNVAIEKRLTTDQMQAIRRQFSGMGFRNSTCNRQ